MDIKLCYQTLETRKIIENRMRCLEMVPDFGEIKAVSLFSFGLQARHPTQQI